MKKALNTLRCDRVTSFYNNVTDQRTASVRLFVFFLSSFPRADTGMWEIFHMGKNNGNPYLVCENKKVIRPLCAYCVEYDNIPAISL